MLHRSGFESQQVFFGGLSSRDCINCIFNCSDLLCIYFFIPWFQYMKFTFSSFQVSVSCMQTVVPTIPFSHFVSLMFSEHLATISFPCVLYQWARSIQPTFRPVRPGKEDHLKRWTCFFETFPVGPNRSIEFWTEISGKFG